MSLRRRLSLQAALFGAAAVWAYATWTRPELDAVARSRFLAWEHDTTDVTSIRYVAPEKAVRVERRTDADGPFYWGSESGAGVRAEEYPVGVAGATLAARLSALRVLRHLGTVPAADRAQYGLAEPRDRIEIDFRGERRELLLGDSVHGGDDRYALDAGDEAGYVLPGEIVRPLRTGEGALRERWIHEFRLADVGRVRALADGRERVMVRGDGGDWAPPDGGQADPAFANFLQRVEQMAIGGFDSLPPPEALAPLLRLEYFDDDGDAMGFLELARYDADERNPYYLRSERTRVWARALTALAERVEEGLADLF